MIRYLFTVLLLLASAFIVRQFLPVFPEAFQARIFLVPLVFLCAAVTLNVSGMLLLSLVCGILWDAQHTILPAAGDPLIYTEPVETLRFGYSIFLFAFAGFVMQGVQPIFQEGKWQLSALVTGVALFLYLLVELLLLSFVRGQLEINGATLKFILYSSLFTMLLSPPIFLLLFKLAELFNYRIRYDGLRKSSR